MNSLINIDNIIYAFDDVVRSGSAEYLSVCEHSGEFITSHGDLELSNIQQLSRINVSHRAHRGGYTTYSFCCLSLMKMWLCITLQAYAY